MISELLLFQRIKGFFANIFLFLCYFMHASLGKAFLHIYYENNLMNKGQKYNMKNMQAIFLFFFFMEFN